jgi:23S rRNA (uracil1939-C5)-methyltransferase
MPDESFDLQLTAMSHGGEALGRHDGRVIFVPFGIPGEKVRVRIVDDKGRFARAELIDVLEASPARVTLRCKHFGVCGGCHWQHIAYAEQLTLKQQVVADQLARVGGLRDVTVYPTIPSPSPWAYRSHATFHVSEDERLGFVALDGRKVMPIEECHIVREEILDFVSAGQTRALASGLSLQNPGKSGGRLRVQVGSDGREWLLAANAVDEQMENAPAGALSGEGVVHYTVRGRRFQVSAGSFFQINLAQAEKLVHLALERLNLQGRERVLDLYSGVGLFTAFLTERAGQVTAVEVFPPAVQDALANLSEFENVEVIEGALEEAMSVLKGRFEAALVDPPRAGIHIKALDALAKKIRPGKIVYVSCDPATLARDAKRLVSAGYLLRDVQPVDMFPQTYHIEAVATFLKPS